MKVLVLAFAMILAATSHAQKITIDDLDYILKNPLEEVEDFLKKKEIKFNESRKNDNGSTSFFYKRDIVKSPNEAEYISVSKEIKDGICYRSSWMTTNEADYDIAKEDAKNRGFKIENSYPVANGIQYKYTNGNMAIYFTKMKLHIDDNTVDIMSYGIMYEDMTLKNSAFKK